MAKKSKIQTPDWVLNGKSEEKPKKKAGKTFKVRRCSECNSDEMSVVVGDAKNWECRKCGFKGTNVIIEELSEDDFMKYLDDKGEDVA